jgi:hypothetical protein
MAWWRENKRQEQQQVNNMQQTRNYLEITSLVFNTSFSYYIHLPLQMSDSGNYTSHAWEVNDTKAAAHTSFQ